MTSRAVDYWVAYPGLNLLKFESVIRNRGGSTLEGTATQPNGPGHAQVQDADDEQPAERSTS
jgi:hypothetical protein